jgi:hypothetical protein
MTRCYYSQSDNSEISVKQHQLAVLKIIYEQLCI